MGSRRFENYSYMTQKSWFLLKNTRMVMSEEANKEEIEPEFIQGILGCQKLFYDIICVCFYGRY